MEEADLLGDRIAIMASGQIQCAGNRRRDHYFRTWTLKAAHSLNRLFALFEEEIRRRVQFSHCERGLVRCAAHHGLDSSIHSGSERQSECRG